MVKIQLVEFINVNDFLSIMELKREMVNLASIHLERKALEWFQWCETGAKNLNWRVFSTDVIIQFGPGKCENLVG